jgi:hypothetical protein
LNILYTVQYLDRNCFLCFEDWKVRSLQLLLTEIQRFRQFCHPSYLFSYYQVCYCFIYSFISSVYNTTRHAFILIVILRFPLQYIMSAGLIFVFFLLGRWKRDKTHFQIVALIEYPQMRSIFFHFGQQRSNAKTYCRLIRFQKDKTLLFVSSCRLDSPRNRSFGYRSILHSKRPFVVIYQIS